MSSHKVKNTAELREKFHQAFAKTATIKAGQGLTKGELKKLERMGWVERLSTITRKKWSEVTGAIEFVWRRKVNPAKPIDSLKS